MREKIVLVIDDDDMNLQIAKMVLEKKVKCRVICADNGREGIEILKKERISLVLLDILMPEFDGIETLKEIRSEEKLKNTAVMMLTAASGIDNLKKVYHLGVTDYIKKPFMPADLVKRVTKKLEELEPEQKILILSDSEKELQKMSEVIEKNFEYEILKSTSEAEMEKILSKNEISLVIIDSRMKFLEGYKFLKKLSGNEKIDKIPVAITNSEKINEVIEKINSPKIEEETVIITENKNKLAHVVTNLIGYELDLKV